MNSRDILKISRSQYQGVSPTMTVIRHKYFSLGKFNVIHKNLSFQVYIFFETVPVRVKKLKFLEQSKIKWFVSLVDIFSLQTMLLGFL